MSSSSSPQQEEEDGLSFASQRRVPLCLSACPCVVFFLAPTRGRRWTLLLERCIRAWCGATSTLYPKSLCRLLPRPNKRKKTDSVETGGGTHGASLTVSSLHSKITLRVVSERFAFALQLSVPRLLPQQQQSLAHTPCLSACPCDVFFLAPTRGRRWTLLLLCPLSTARGSSRCLRTISLCIAAECA